MKRCKLYIGFLFTFLDILDHKKVIRDFGQNQNFTNVQQNFSTNFDVPFRPCKFFDFFIVEVKIVHARTTEQPNNQTECNFMYIDELLCPNTHVKINQTINKSNYFDSFDCLIIFYSSCKKW